MTGAESTRDGPQIIHVSELDDPRLVPYRNQRDAWLHAGHNQDRVQSGDPGAKSAEVALFMAEGSLVIQALLRSRFKVDSVLATPSRFGAVEQDLARLAPDAPVYLAPPPLLEQIVGFNLHRGLLAAGRRGDDLDARQLIASSRVLVIAEDLSNHDNVGGLFRTVSALADGAGVLLSPRCCDPLYRKALRVSMGHALGVPFARLEPWPEGLRLVADAGFRIVALSTAGAGSVRRLEVGRDERVALLVGAEGPGLSDSTLQTLGGHAQTVTIPMRSGVDSLNVVVALGIALDRVIGGGSID